MFEAMALGLHSSALQIFYSWIRNFRLIHGTAEEVQTPAPQLHKAHGREQPGIHTRLLQQTGRGGE